MLSLRFMEEKIRFAVVGLGNVAQSAMLPAFQQVKKAQLSALVSGDPSKLDQLGMIYGIKALYPYTQYDELLQSGAIDAVYIALPNSMHRSYAERALRAGKHVLCEAPMTTSSNDCLALIEASEEIKVKLMIAYQTHFDCGNLQTIDLAQSGEIGDLRFFSSSYSIRLHDKDSIRFNHSLGGGPLWDLGVYCINAARTLFQSQPIEVTAICAASKEPQFVEVGEMIAVLMKFPGERLACFYSSLGGAECNFYEVLGTEGRLHLNQAYSATGEMRLDLWIKGHHRSKKFARHDLFGAELTYFTDCILRDRPVEPCGREGLADLRVIEAIIESVRSGVTITVQAVYKPSYAEVEQIITLPPVSRPKTVHNVSFGH